MIQTSTQQPLVSIVIPVYNGSNYVSEAIQSALAQTYKNCEIIVVNDGSDDDGRTDSIIRSFGNQVRYFTKDNGGVASALNLAINVMKGEYFSWLSHDDLYSPIKVELQISRAHEVENPNAVIYCDYSIFDKTATSARVRNVNVDKKCFRYWLTENSGMHGCTLLIPKKALDAVGPFDETLRSTQDYDMWYRLAESHPFLLISEDLVSSRMHSAQDGVQFNERAFRESCVLHTRFVQNLRSEDIPRDAFNDAGSGFLALADSLWNRGFREAAAVAEERARAFGVNAFIVGMHRGLSLLKYYFFSILRISLNPVIRMKLRDVLRLRHS